MKSSFIKQTLVAGSTALTLLLGSCGKDFVSIQPRGQFLTDNYYSNRTEAYTGLVAVYDLLRKNAGGFDNMITFLNAGSDDCFAGGGGPTDGAGIHGFDEFRLNSTIIPDSYFSDFYQGIFRANILLQKMEGVPMDAAEKARFIAETKTLRALYYFNLVRLFGNIPLITEPVTTAGIYDVAQAPKADIYAQMEKDITEALPDLPANLTAAEAGRINIPAAKAILGKIYLYDNKMTEAAAQFADVNQTPGQVTTYGNRLLATYGNLWSFTNKFNQESILSARHTDKSFADWGFWGGSNDEGNSVNQMVGPRNYGKTGAAAPEIPSGWSFNPVTNELWAVMQNDPRAASSVLNMNALVAANQAVYSPADANTGLFINKFIPRTTDIRPGAGTQELNYQQDDYIIRLADTYLMEAEALGGTGARAQALLTAVRARVGLAPVAVSLAAIKAERRLELAFEGHRFFDLVRWGDAPAVLGPRGFQAGRDEVLPIPQRELLGTKLVQNPGFQ